MISKTQLLTIHDLKLSGKLDNMDDKHLEAYCKTLDAFIEAFPIQECELKKSFEDKDFNSFSKTLLIVKDSLVKIYADDLVENCLKLISEVKTGREEKIEAYLNYFLTVMSMLSIDIQMAQHKDNVKDEHATENAPIAADSEHIGEQGHKTILAVDDVSLILNGLKSVLQSTPYKFTGVTSGEVALRFLKTHTPDLFMLDIEMPGMNGYELAKKIKESGQTAPIIFLTGNATRDYVLKAIEVGAADFIVKPINKDQVLDKIIKYIR